jgi:hypothetical protein
MKANVRQFALILAGLTFVGTGHAAPPAKKHMPDFRLTISTEGRTFAAQKDMEIQVTVVETNISNHMVNAGGESDPGRWYTMSVSLNGNPAPISQRYREIVTPKKYDPNVLLTGDGAFWEIKPRGSLKFEVPLAAFFDLSAPGSYEITFSRGTDPGQPDNIEVRSNTIKITVVPKRSQ